MKTLKLLIAGFIINLIWFLTTFAANPTEVRISEPVGGGILLGKSLFRRDIEGGIKDSYIFSQLIPFAIKYGIRLAIGLSVITLIIGGYQFIVAFGDTEKRQSAQKTIMYALIGLIIALTAFGIVTVVTSISYVDRS